MRIWLGNPCFSMALVNSLASGVVGKGDLALKG